MGERDCPSHRNYRLPRAPQQGWDSCSPPVSMLGLFLTHRNRWVSWIGLTGFEKKIQSWVGRKGVDLEGVWERGNINHTTVYEILKELIKMRRKRAKCCGTHLKFKYTYGEMGDRQNNCLEALGPGSLGYKPVQKEKQERPASTRWKETTHFSKLALHLHVWAVVHSGSQSHAQTNR